MRSEQSEQRTQEFTTSLLITKTELNAQTTLARKSYNYETGRVASIEATNPRTTSGTNAPDSSTKTVKQTVRYWRHFCQDDRRK